jgi:hypothetical protein
MTQQTIEVNMLLAIKKYLFIFAILFSNFLFSETLFSQIVSRSLISSAGEYRRTADFHISFSIGEPVSFTSKQHSQFWRIGFQQGVDDVSTKTLNSRYATLSLNIYPNPLTSGNTMFFTCSSPLTDYDDLVIMNLHGQIVKIEIANAFQSTNSVYSIPINWQGAGIHWLIIYRNGQPIGKSSFIKL